MLTSSTTGYGVCRGISLPALDDTVTTMLASVPQDDRAARHAGLAHPDTPMSNFYEQPAYAGAQALTDAIEADDANVLAPMIVAASLYEDDFNIAYGACMRLSTHADEVVRGNAILGLGHLARLFEQLGPEAPEIVKRGLTDSSAYVRGQAHATAGDLQHFLGVEVRDAQP
jgi:hypothetical protein